MKTLFHASTLVGALFALLMFDACGSPDGGGTGGTGVVQPALSASVAQPTQSVGVIHAKTTIGDIVNVQLNHHRFDVSRAAITKDGKPATSADLRVGMVVTVKGDTDPDGTTGTAMSVNYRNRVLGMLTEIDTSALQLTVLGQTVHLNADTTFYDASTQTAIALTALAVGDYVEVSGFTDALNAVQASYVERKPAVNRFEVKGNIVQLDAKAHRFHIGGLTVNYGNGATESEHQTEYPILHDGDAVAVSGREYDPVDQLLIADNATGETSDLDTRSDSLIELEGMVTAVPSPDRFTVGIQAVLMDSSTVVESGALTLNAWITASGTLNSNGILARSVEMH